MGQWKQWTVSRICSTNEPMRDKTRKKTHYGFGFMYNKDSGVDQPRHLQSLIRVFTVRMDNIYGP